MTDTPRVYFSEPTSETTSSWKKYKSYKLDVDPSQDDKAKELLLCMADRPHMRAFHCAWWSFFIAFFIWFALTPLLSQIKEDLNLTKKDIWEAAIAGVTSTILVRLIVGPLCDVYGARVVFSILLCAGAIPVGLTGLVQDAKGLMILRAFIGIVGGTFVTCEYWTTRMFTKEVVGTANGLAAGWGNLGAGASQLIVGSYLYPLFELIWGGDSEMAWRTVCILPAIIAFITGVAIYYISDDAPKGNYHELKANGAFRRVSALTSFFAACSNMNTWIFFLQYACSFGVELTMATATHFYFEDHFGLTKEAAGAIASIFGWLNLFARGLGGFMSDVCYHRWGMRGRLWAQTICLLAVGILVVLFVNTESLAGSIIALVSFSLFVAAANGTALGIVPYIDPVHTGSVIGIVGAGGNAGAMTFGLLFRDLSYNSAFHIMGYSVLASSLLSALVHIKGYSSLLCGNDRDVDRETGEVLQRLLKPEEATIEGVTESFKTKGRSASQRSIMI